MPGAARGHAGAAIDAPGKIANKDFSHRLFHLLAGPMALDAILNIANASFGVHLRHLGLAMVVATVATVGRIIGGVTGLAGRLFAFISMIEWEAVFD
jgi:hypothetical protein